MEEKKMFATRIDPDILRRLKHLSIDTDSSIGPLTEEAVVDLLKKYESRIFRKI
jgi:predicted transcriptional regulator